MIEAVVASWLAGFLLGGAIVYIRVIDRVNPPRSKVSGRFVSYKPRKRS
jgi:hypothetical protein